MKKKYLLIFATLIALVVASTSCKKEPQASFTYTLKGYSVSFSNTSSNATSYTWNFGDGSTSKDKHPTHVYAKSGRYKVGLLANTNLAEQTISISSEGTGSGGSTDEPVATTAILKSITVNNMPLLDVNGQRWDIGTSDADLTFTLYKNKQLVYTWSKYLNNVSSLPKTMVLEQSFQMPVTNIYEVYLYDYDDSSSDDLIGKLNIDLKPYAKSCPSKVEFVNGQCKITLNVTWQ